MIRVLEAVFVKSATAPVHFPTEPIPEVAFAGRSNVGKSSMINALTSRRKLVRVSHTPGRTKTLNFFDVRLEDRGTRRVLRLCDLPGYGFARASKAERRSWREMISRYLSARGTLSVVVSLIDAEVGPTADDFALLDLLQGLPPRILVVATKLDRVSRNRRAGRLAELAQLLEVPSAAVLGFSATDGLGLEEVWRALLDATGPRGPAPAG